MPAITPTLFATDAAGYKYYYVAGAGGADISGSITIDNDAYCVAIGYGAEADLSGNGGGSGGFSAGVLPADSYDVDVNSTGTVGISNAGQTVVLVANNGSGKNGGNGGGGSIGQSGGNGGDLAGNIGANGGTGGSTFGGGGGAVAVWGGSSPNGTSGTDGSNGGTGGGGGAGPSGLYGGGAGIYGGGASVLAKGFGAGGSVNGKSSDAAGGGGGFDPRILYIYAHSLQSTTDWSDAQLSAALNSESKLVKDSFTNIDVLPETSFEGAGLSGAIFYVEYPPIVPVACVLKGTRIRVPKGEIPIEQLKIGDSVVNEQGLETAVTHIEQTEILFRDCTHQECLSRVIYKISANGRDLFVTRNHEIVKPDGSLQIPELCNGVEAVLYEIPNRNGWFHVYHLRLADDYHYIANGVTVTSLGSSTKHPATGKTTKKQVNMTQCRGSVRKIS